MAEKNAAALIREDTFTIKVRFLNPSNIENDFQGLSSDPNDLDITNPSAKEYLYVCTFPVKEGEFVVVPARRVPTLAVVSKVHPGVEIEREESRKFAWVIAKVDVAEFYANMNRNAQIESMIQKAYVSNARATFRNVILGSLDEAERLAITDMLKAG